MSSALAPPVIARRVGIVSDDRIFSEGIRRIVSGDGTLTCIPISWRFPVSAAAIRAAALGAVVVDSRSSGAQELCTSLEHDGPPVLCVALGDDELSALDALAAGARGILFTNTPPEDVTKAIRVVIEGGIWAPRQAVVAAWFNQSRQRPCGASPIINPQLTPREMEVFRHAAAGLGNREVAATLAISEATVKAHLTSIFQKLGLRGRARLAAAYHGIVSPAPRHGEPNRLPLRARLGRTTFGGVVRRPSN